MAGRLNGSTGFGAASTDVRPRERRARPWSADRRYRLWLVAPGLFLLFLFVWPLLRVVTTSFIHNGLDFSSYRAIATDPVYVTVLLYTARVSLVVTLLCVVLAYPVAWTVSNLRGHWLHLSLGLILVPFWTSTVIRTYAWLIIFQRRGALNSALLSLGILDHPIRLIDNGVGMQIAMVHIMLPFMILPILSAMSGFDRTLLRAAAVMGANPLRQFWHVHLPLTTPGVSAGCALVFIMSLGFFITPALLSGGQHMMAAVLIQQQASRLLNWPMASAIGTVLLVATCLLYIGYDSVSRRVSGGNVLGVGD